MEYSHTTDSGAQNEHRLKMALFCTGSYFIVEVIAGILTGSLALLSDAAHMLTDVTALIIALIAIRIGRRSVDARRTYGYRRFEILAAMLNAILLFLVALYILYEGYLRFINPPEIHSGWMLGVASVGLLINIISTRLLVSGSKDSLNVKAAYLDALADMVSSIGVIIAALVISFTGWVQIDSIIAILIGLWILPRGWKILSESINILLEGVPEGIEVEKLLNELKKVPNVTEVHDLHIWSITSGQHSLTAHLVVSVYPENDSLIHQASAIGVFRHAGVQSRLGYRVNSRYL